MSCIRHLVNEDESLLTIDSKFPLFNNNYKKNLYVLDSVLNTSFMLVNLLMIPTRGFNFARRKCRHREALVTCILFVLSMSGSGICALNLLWR